MATTKKTSAKKAATKKTGAKKAAKKDSGLTAAQRDRLAEGTFAFPKERKEPLNDAKHVRAAISRFDQVEDVTDAERDRAWKRILTAAKKFDVEVREKSWRDLNHGGKPKKAKERG